jgi:hypothetical protein
MIRLRMLVAAVALAGLAACTTLNQQQKAEYDLMKQDGVLVEEKNPVTGAWLGILPGFGAFYAREPLVGVVDLLLWPLSVLWDPVVGYESSKKVNYTLTTNTLARDKEKALADLQAQRDRQEIDAATFASRQAEIERKYTYRKP